ncbi:dihydroorotase [Mesoflavibacter sabulilitoris]|uniref:Dihydroorotase n=1 Tax=Mesoflavibacter zeaxanthinifaciens subsp. sabulilitoris TaxID=1520893 RepID=A0A2T1NGR6_9FLAO|nr:dihydroorotase [Mesoflavibacter zeaxanthinifaciens]MBB3122877.1 dihydroorotase [Mesoflavibacter zeaxanthinifaciens subsp. sabulilitoris]PSG92046.1 dihydroorotase [Mesoflavibacter zeaxanthinifaciens subsp. sabulilitoris]
MNVLIKSATVIDTSSKFHNQIVDVLIEKGKISQIAKCIKNTSNFKEIELDNLHISQGWFDSSVCFGEPGFEDRETIENGLKTAAKSGFTIIALQANTNPIIDTSSDVTFVLSKAQSQPVDLLPIGALTKNSESVDLAELFDMKNAGAVAFGDYKKPITNPNLLKIALQYASNFDGLVCSFPLEQKIAGKGIVNEHVSSTILGLKGSPNLAESLQVARDLYILEYAGGKLHIPTISTKESVKLIREAKQKKIDVTCSVAIHNLFLTDDVLNEFDTRYKVNPPLRTQDDIDALIEGIKDGTIDMVTSDHNPQTIEEKKVEFDHANYGTIGLESAFGALNQIFSTKKSIQLLTKGKERFGTVTSKIEEGEVANITLFNPNEKYVFGKSNILSKSKNSAFLGQELKGKVYGIYANKKIVL